MLAPTLGPAVGGFITDRYSWHWLFLINVPTGIIVALLVAWTVDIDRPDWRRFGSVDLLALPLLAVFLGSLQLVLKEAPHRGWGSTEALLLAGICVVCGGGVDLALFAPFGAADRPVRIPRMQFCGRMLLQLCSRHRPLRGNLSVAGVSRPDPKLRRPGDRRDHDGDRCRPARDGAGRHRPRTARRAPAAGRRGLCLARRRPGRQWLYDLRDGFLGIVLAAARPRLRHYAVSVAVHRAGIERASTPPISRMRAACSI